MSVHVTSWVLRNSKTRLGERLVLYVLADYANEDGSAFPSVKTIANEAKLSERQTHRALRNLEASERIKKIGTSHLRTTIYKVRMDRSAEKDSSGLKLVRPDSV